MYIWTLIETTIDEGVTYQAAFTTKQKAYEALCSAIYVEMHSENAKLERIKAQLNYLKKQYEKQDHLIAATEYREYEVNKVKLE